MAVWELSYRLAMAKVKPAVQTESLEITRLSLFQSVLHLTSSRGISLSLS